LAVLDLLVLELVLVIALFLLAGAARRQWSIAFQHLETRFDALARRRTQSILLVVVLCLGFRLALLPLLKIPTPGVHDEFSYLLAADTFAGGRLTNPTHPMWVHFETFHVNQRPTYQSMYQPAQGLVLAAGKVLLGHPWFGVWFSTGVMCGAMTWALYGWLPPRWALLGGLIALMRLGVFSYWMNSYWGGSVPAIGGALVIGALPRIMRSARARDVLLMAFGMSILACSRPYEGAVLAFTAFAILLYASLVRQPKAMLRTFCRTILAPTVGVLFITGIGLMYYFSRVTGHPFLMPYQLNRATYGVSQAFYWQKIPPIPVLRHKVMSDFYLGRDLDWYLEGLTLRGFIAHQLEKLQLVWLFYIGAVLLIPVAMFGRVARDRRVRAVWLLTAAVGFAIMIQLWRITPHYPAPITAAIYVLLLQGLRHWRATNRRTAGPLLAWGVPLICVLMLVVRTGAQVRPIARYLAVERNAWWCFIPGGIIDRDRILEELRARPGQHLVLVRYRDRHDVYEEWVYISANIDSQKVVWARDMGHEANRELIEYYSNRQVWIVDADAVKPQIATYISGSLRAGARPVTRSPGR
jgi:hypothetical protein